MKKKKIYLTLLTSSLFFLISCGNDSNDIEKLIEEAKDYAEQVQEQQSEAEETAKSEKPSRSKIGETKAYFMEDGIEYDINRFHAQKTDGKYGIMVYFNSNEKNNGVLPPVLTIIDFPFSEGSHQITEEGNFKISFIKNGEPHFAKSGKLVLTEADGRKMAGYIEDMELSTMNGNSKTKILKFTFEHEIPEMLIME